MPEASPVTALSAVAGIVGLNNVGGDPPSAVVDAATIAARLNGP